ncbi:hypothetical protein CR513_45087, partial [Mucuna pruriens]
MGTQGAINYNLELLPRQAGYPMALPPPKEAITPFIIHDLGAQDGGCLKNASLTFEDPRLSASGEPHSSHARPHNPLKQKSDDNPEHPSGQGANKKAYRESWSWAISQERYIREIEWDQALDEKEELKAALPESQKKEAEVSIQLSQLREKTRLLEDESARARLQSKHLENKRWKTLAELVEEQAKTIEAKIQAEAAT